MTQLIAICNVIDPVVTIMAKMAFVFVAYKAMQAMNIYINKNNK